MVDKYLKVQSGFQQEQLFQTVSSGTAGAGIGIATNSDGLVDASLLPSGLDGALVLNADLAIDTGDILHVNTTGGWVRADASVLIGANPRYAQAVARTSAASGDPLPGILPGNVAPVGGSGAGGSGVDLFIRAFGGGTANIAPAAVSATGSGGIFHRVGRTITAATFLFNPGEPVVLSGD